MLAVAVVAVAVAAVAAAVHQRQPISVVLSEEVALSVSLVRELAVGVHLRLVRVPVPQHDHVPQTRRKSCRTAWDARVGERSGGPVRGRPLLTRLTTAGVLWRTARRREQTAAARGMTAAAQPPSYPQSSPSRLASAAASCLSARAGISTAVSRAKVSCRQPMASFTPARPESAPSPAVAVGPFVALSTRSCNRHCSGSPLPRPLAPAARCPPPAGTTVRCAPAHTLPPAVHLCSG